MASADDETKQAEYLQKAFGWYLVLSVILILLLPGLVYGVTEYLFPVPERFVSAVRWIVVLAVAEYILAIPIMIAQAFTLSNQGFKQYSTFISISGVFRYGLMFLAAWLYRDPVLVVLFVVSRRVFDLFIGRQFLLMPPKAAWRPRINISEFKTILANSSIMSLAMVLQITIASLGAILVNRYFGIAVLGNYRAAFDLASKVWFFSNGIGLVVFPKFSQILSAQGQRESLNQKVRIWLEKSFAGYLMISILAVLCASWGLTLMGLGEKQIVYFFILLIVGVCLNAHSNVSYEYLLADNRYRVVAFLSLGILVSILLSYFLLVDLTGPYAIGWAWLISQAISAFVVDELVVHNRDIPCKNRFKMLFIKSVLLLAALIYMCTGLGLLPISHLYLAPVVLLLCALVLIKDFKELKLFFKQ